MSMRRRRSISSSMLVIREVDDEVTDSADALAAAARADVELDIVVVVRLSGSVPVRDSRSERSTDAGWLIVTVYSLTSLSPDIVSSSTSFSASPSSSFASSLFSAPPSDELLLLESDSITKIFLLEMSYNCVNLRK